MKNIEKSIKKQIVSNKKAAGGNVMRTHAVSDPRFSRVVSGEMFNKREEPDDDIEEACEDEKETENPAKHAKPIKKGKKKGNKKEKRG
jgi:hypothetical protein